VIFIEENGEDRTQAPYGLEPDPAGESGEGMSDYARVLEAVAALIAADYSVEPLGATLEFWMVDGEVLSDGDLIAKAARLGRVDLPRSRVAKP
jgi:hypothetical protein